MFFFRFLTDTVRNQLTAAYRAMSQEARESESPERLDVFLSEEPGRRKSSGNIRAAIPHSSSQNGKQQSPQETGNGQTGKVSSSQGGLKGVRRKDQTGLRNKINTKPAKHKIGNSNSTVKTSNTDKKNHRVNGEIVRPPSILSNHFANESGTFEYPDEDGMIPATIAFSQRVEGVNMPDKVLSLTRVYGYKSDCHNGNLVCLSSSEIAYAVGSIVVIWSSVSGKQRFYTGHTRDIDSLACYDGKIIASLETLFLKEDNHHVKVNIWDAFNLKTMTTFSEPLKDQRLLGIYFSPNGMLLILKGTTEAIYGRIWDWKSQRKKVSTAFYVSLSVISALLLFGQVVQTQNN